ncbi:unknown [[Mannheimia] succiniciproducens MBEL55E]|uniref:Uncharacterized protein n=1 Tax=Mannheimia succiniciproducens (strain KCTC 0769BP / MBEL55E) TaxID=221988 RepID=Q65UI4_MANSM|nr:unknown [[Mannheimia] succiniciproducens MBEL55E]
MSHFTSIFIGVQFSNIFYAFLRKKSVKLLNFLSG